jgi:putative transposase
MKKSRYSKEQVALILREADKAPIAEVAERHGVSEQSIQLAQALRRERDRCHTALLTVSRFWVSKVPSGIP